ncbi:putative pectinesterase/pectinesterase inhibitor 12 [Quercus suber]|uniref:Pectinesterase/pectinesterase inhibitor 12 n=1 Tax=Quercus suber TaxID=58331 RepID=A0AAW0J661_QUESU
MPATKRLLYILFISPTCSTLNLHRAVKGEGFTVDDLTIGYNARPEKDQAVTLAVAATDVAFYRCKFSEYKDTLFTYCGKQF